MTLELNPKVSIIMPCYNNGKTIADTINSVLRSSYKNYEFLIYDDASTDNSYDILIKATGKRKEVQILRGLKNKGAGFARNQLLKIATGEIIAFIDADDLWSSEKLEQQIEFLKEKDADIVCSSYKIKDEQGKCLGTRRVKENISKKDMYWSNQIPTSFTIVRSNLLKAKSMPEIRRRQDYAYWIQLFENNKEIKCIGLDKIHGEYTKRKQSLSSNKLKNIKYNYQMFHGVLKYGVFKSTVLVIFNMIEKATRSLNR